MGWRQATINLLIKDRPENINPMVRANGLLEPRRRCKDCKHLFYHMTVKRYYKCDLRGFSYGAATDHRVNWWACTKFKEEKNANH